MKTKLFFIVITFIMLVSFQVFSQVNVKIQVDMSSETVSADGVHVAGSLNGWSPSDTLLTQEGSSGIYSVVLALNPGWYEYKFLNGNAWGTEEAPSGACALWDNNRLLYINDSGVDVDLELVPFNGCNADGTGFTLTYNVDMSSETVSANGVHLAGSITGWQPNKFQLTDVSGNIYSRTLRLPTPSDYAISLHYKYLNGDAWGTDETPGPEATCATVTGTDRILTVSTSGEQLLDVFNGCNYTLNIKDEVFNETSVIYNKPLAQLIISQNNGMPNAKVKIFDISGKLIKSKSAIGDGSSTLIDVNGLSGLYFVKIENNNLHSVKKVLIY
ncbi:T9SS type A sorting domain-containing protein [Seonamhaeicola sp. MEBiC1930]|uniref:T9SS type A sorting domain-containing protein n=1 Tax=Seonamhaeicola sp. MEBiC01930 TaxID=2976768 RepID=UPI00324A0603